MKFDNTEQLPATDYPKWLDQNVLPGKNKALAGLAKSSPEGLDTVIAHLVTDLDSGEITLCIAGDKDEFMSKLKFSQMPAVKFSSPFGK